MISQETIQEIKNRLVAVYNPLEIYLFGSYAWGTPNEDSDLDLLIVIEKSDEKIHCRSRHASDALWTLAVPKDLLVYTQKEFTDRINDQASLCRKIKKEGVLLYERVH